MHCRAFFPLLAIALGAGCQEGKPTGAGAAPSAAELDEPSMFGAFDSKAEIRALQGTWKVKDSAFSNEPSIWTIRGEKLAIKRGDEVEEGEIEIQQPGQLAFVKKSAGGGAARTYYAYARSGSDVYIGLGAAGIKVGESYMVGDDGLVVLRASTCRYFKRSMFGGFEAKPLEVQCEIERESDRKALRYKIPDPFKQGEMRAKSVNIVGDALLSRQMMGRKAVRVR